MDSNVTAKSDTFDLSRVFQNLKRRALLIVCIAVLSGIGAGVYAFHQPNIYEATAKLDIDLSSPQLSVDSLATAQNQSNNQQKMTTQLSIITSQAIAWDVIERLSLFKNPQFAGSPKWKEARDVPGVNRLTMLRIFSAGLAVEFQRGTEIAVVTYRSSDPTLAAEIANTIADAYIDRTYQSKFTATSKQSQWLDDQLGGIRKKVSQDEQTFAEFQRRTGLFLTEQNHSAIFDRYNQINEALSAAQVQRIGKTIRYRQSIEPPVNGNVSLISNSAIEAARARVAGFEADLALLTPKYGDSYPKVAQLKSEIAQARATVTEETTAERDRIRAEYELALRDEQTLSGALEEQKQQIFGTNENALQYSLLQRQVASGRDLIETLTRQLQVARLSAGLNAESITVLDAALRPSLPVSPRKTLDIEIGFAAGLFLGIVGALFVESLNQTIQTVSDVIEHVDLPILGIIPPFSQTAGERKEARAGFKIGTTVVENPNSPYAESFRRLRSSLLLSTPANPPKIIVVCSAWPQEGKSTTAAGLAEVFAQTGKRVLLVDADLRRPTLHFIFGLKGNMGGLSQLLTASDLSPLTDVLQPLENLPSLFVLPAGIIPPSPSELLLSERMRALIMAWREAFDFVVIDTAPILAVSDTTALSQEADAVVLMVRAALTTRNSLKAAVGAFSSVKAHLAGVALNGFAPDAKSGYYYNEYYGGKLNAFRDEGWHEE